MKKKEFINRIRKDIQTDCKDFWPLLESAFKLASIPVRAKPVRKSFRPIFSVYAGIMAVILIGGMTLIFMTKYNRGLFPFTPGSSHGTSPGNTSTANPSMLIITANDRDAYIAREDGMSGPDYISPALQEALEKSPAEAYYRVLVYVPGIGDFRDTYSEGGVTIRELENGEWKKTIVDLPSDERDRIYQETMAKIKRMTTAAVNVFNENAMIEYGSPNAAPAVMTSDYHVTSYSFVDILPADKIRQLAEKQIYIALAMPERPDNYPDTITDRLAIRLNGEGKQKVHVYLKIDNIGSSQRYNTDYYLDKVQILSRENATKSYVENYLNAFIKDNSLSYIEKTADIIPPNNSDPAFVRCFLSKELTKDQIMRLAADKRVLVVCPDDFEEPSGQTEE